MFAVQIAPLFGQIVSYEATMTVMGLVLTAEETTMIKEITWYGTFDSSRTN
jgi:hypothetical protein